MNSQSDKHRLFLIDMMRVLCAIIVFMRHSITMFGCSYSYLVNAVSISLTSPAMTCFFIISGFSIHYQHRKEEITAPWTRDFLKKRLIAIMPSYLLVVLIWPLAYPSQLENWALLLPIDLLGVQTAYRTLFGILHNGGTWFVSCMLMAYFSYPVIKAILDPRNMKMPAIVIVITFFLLIYSNDIISKFSLDSLYSNPIARTAEFIIGAAMAEMVFKEKESGNYTSMKNRRNASPHEKMPIYVIVIISIIAIMLAVAARAGKRAFVFGYMPIPVILAALLVASHIRSKTLENSKVLSTLSGMLYQFFLTQIFLWSITAWVLKIIGVEGNVAKIAVSLFLCTAISFVAWKFYDKPVRRVLSQKLLIK